MKSRLFLCAVLVFPAACRLLAEDTSLFISPNTFVSGKTYNVALQFIPCGSHDFTKAQIFAASTGITLAPLKDASL